MQDDNEKHLIREGTSFRVDPYLYRVLQPDQDFLDEDGFCSYAEMVARIRNNGKRIILSIGESSTSGWDTTITPTNRERKAQGLLPISAFFRYRNYTDMVRSIVGDEYEVVNAGVPGHTILSGMRRLKMLHRAFARDGLSVAYVIVHFGNNDCLWEGNFQDRYHLHLHPRSPSPVEGLRRRWHRVDTSRIVLRTSAPDFGRYYRQLIRYANRMGAPPIILQPEIPIYWKPGSRYVDFNFEAMKTSPGGALAIQEMEVARRQWAEVVEAPYSGQKIDALTAAAERDFIIPRIKQAHLAELQRACHDTGTPLVQTPVPRDEDEKTFFVDYCHPREIINEEIARQISGFIADYEQSK
jgi:hypothetical protein